jgi:nicotinamidase-related amidase
MARQLTKNGFLHAQKSLFLMCDIQDAFRPGMKYFDAMVINTKKLIAAGKILDIPLLVTEHYPERLGKTVKDLDVSHAEAIISKTLFSMTTPQFMEKFDAIVKRNNVEAVILFGLESHICLEQTAMNLRELGYNVHIVADCAMSRSLEDRKYALERLRDLGCTINTSESVIFKFMKGKEHANFKPISALVRQMPEPIETSKL